MRRDAHKRPANVKSRAERRGFTVRVEGRPNAWTATIWREDLGNMPLERRDGFRVRRDAYEYLSDFVDKQPIGGVR